MLLENKREEAEAVMREVQRAVIGKEECILQTMAAILAGGHILIEDVPGVGKTTLAMAFARAMKLDSRRTQFTPDVLPADILGFSLYQKDEGEFHYQKGAVMCNLYLADEINRTSPKTQSALLEVMEENQVTVDGIPHPVPQPFIVMATENPAGSVGTQLLPESQLDRFMIRISMGYPSLEDEIAIAKGKGNCSPLEEVQGVIDGQELIKLREEVNQVFIHDTIYAYLCRLAGETRKHNLIELGISPRGTIALVRMSKAVAFLDGRDYVTPEDVQSVFPTVASHRIVLNAKARVAHVPVDHVLEQIVASVKIPNARMKR